MTAVESRPPKGPPKGWRGRARASALKAVGPPDMDGLSSTLKRGALYSAAALLFGQVISLAQTLVLARLLTPSDLGIYVAGTILSGFLISVTEGGLRGALIQRETETATAAETVFWATGGTGMLLALVAIGSAPLVGFIANFGPEDTATVVGIAVANSGILLIHALTNVPDGLMQRQFNFRRRLIVDPARMAMFAVVSVGFAAAGYGPWAQVIGNYAAMLTWLGLSWWFAGWWPGFTKPSYRLWREMAKFAYPLMIEGIVEKIRTSAETAIIARGLGSDPLGQYRYGQRLSLIPGTAVVQIGSYVLFPAFSRLANDPPRLLNAFLRAAQWAWIASAAVAGLIVAIGEPAVVVLLGDEWAFAGLVFVALSGYGLGIALQAAGSEAIKATGRSQLLNWTTATSIVLGIGLLLLLMPPFGLVGVGLSVSITELAIGAVILVLTYRVIPYSIPGMVRMLLPPLLVAGAAAAAVGYLEHWIVLSATRGLFLGLVFLTGESILFAVLFLAGMALVEPKLARRAVKAVKAKLRRGKDEEDGDDEEDDGIERRDPRLDPPTMLIPVFAADETGEYGRRQMRDWGSPTAQTMVLPVVRPANPLRPPVGVEETARVSAHSTAESTTKMAARLAAQDDAVERAEDAIEAGDRPAVGSLVSALDGPTEMALPARPAGRSGAQPQPAPDVADGGRSVPRPSPTPRGPDTPRPSPVVRGGEPAAPGPRRPGPADPEALHRGGPVSPAEGLPPYNARNSGGFPRPQGGPGRPARCPARPAGPGSWSARSGPTGRLPAGRPGPAPQPYPGGGPRPPAPGPNGGPNGAGRGGPGPTGRRRPDPPPRWRSRRGRPERRGPGRGDAARPRPGRPAGSRTAPRSARRPAACAAGAAQRWPRTAPADPAVGHGEPAAAASVPAAGTAARGPDGSAAGPGTGRTQAVGRAPVPHPAAPPLPRQRTGARRRGRRGGRSRTAAAPLPRRRGRRPAGRFDPGDPGRPRPAAGPAGPAHLMRNRVARSVPPILMVGRGRCGSRRAG